MTLSEAKAVVEKYNGKEKHTLGEMAKFTKARRIIREAQLKIASGN